MLSLITDRTQADVDAAIAMADKIKAGQATAAEIAEFLDMPRGKITPAHLNRIVGALKAVADSLTEYGYPVAIDSRSDWTYADDFLSEDLALMLADLEQLRSAIHTDAPAVPQDLARWQEANDYESIIGTIDNAIQQMVAGWYELGEIYAGEV